MVLNHPGKKPPPSNSGTAPRSLKKSSKGSSKSDDQIEYLMSHWLDFKAHQAAGTLDRFWLRVFDGWYKKWPIPPTPASIEEHGSSPDAASDLQSKTNGVSA